MSRFRRECCGILCDCGWECGTVNDHKDLRVSGGIVGPSDIDSQEKSVGNSDKIDFSLGHRRLGRITRLSTGRAARTQHVQKDTPSIVIQGIPERQKGKFVGIIHELAKLWHVNLVQAPLYPIEAAAKQVGDSD